MPSIVQALRLRDFRYPLTLLLEPIPDAADGLNVMSILAELLSQTGDLHVNRSLGDRIVFAFHGIDDLRPRESPAGLAGQEMQQAEFGIRQIARLAIQQHFVPARMDHDFVDPNRRPAPRPSLSPVLAAATHECGPAAPAG